MSFSPAQSLPAADANLKVTATPLSLCALRAVDQSVLLLKPEAELSPQSVSPTAVLVSRNADIRPFLLTMTTEDKILSMISMT